MATKEAAVKVNKDRLVKLRVTEEEETKLKELAEQKGLTLSEYLRRRGLRRRVKGEQSGS